jgi:hypothetical protein
MRLPDASRSTRQAFAEPSRIFAAGYNPVSGADVASRQCRDRKHRTENEPHP